jgi:hypothetical protein
MSWTTRIGPADEIDDVLGEDVEQSDNSTDLSCWKTWFLNCVWWREMSVKKLGQVEIKKSWTAAMPRAMIRLFGSFGDETRVRSLLMNPSLKV